MSDAHSYKAGPKQAFEVVVGTDSDVDRLRRIFVVEIGYHGNQESRLGSYSHTDRDL